MKVVEEKKKREFSNNYKDVGKAFLSITQNPEAIKAKADEYD